MSTFRPLLDQRNSISGTKYANASSAHSLYRPDIDGLRAVAVLSVMLFHLDVALFSGGFTGVDVFFVISGYLITNIIVSDLELGKFSFSRFYLRRVRRLFPALFVTLVATWVAGYYFLSPHHYQGLSASVVSSIFFTSNFLFWSEAGYFDTEAIYKPLLHTWSLAVEEQFYFVWPALLVFLFGLKQRFLIPVVLIFAGVLAIVGAEISMRYDPAGAFYLAPYRVSEFAIGALCVWIYRSSWNPCNWPKWLVEAGMVLGLLLIAIPIFVFSKDTPFPGLTALVPTFGTGLAILLGNDARVSRFLANPINVGIGLISYSLYLVHWPIIVYAHILKTDGLSEFDKFAIVLASIAISTAIYWFVEKPIRRPSKERQLSPMAFSASCATMALMFASISGLSWYQEGWPTRLDDDQASTLVKIDRSKEDKIAISVCRYDGRGCLFGAVPGNDRIDVVLVGDSHANHWVYGLHYFLNARNLSGLMISGGGGVAPLKGGKTYSGRGLEPKETDKVFAAIDKVNPRIVVLSARWQLYYHTSSPEKHKFYFNYGDHVGRQVDVSAKAMQAAASDTIDYLTSRNYRVIILGQVPYFGTQPLNCFSRPSWMLRNLRMATKSTDDRNDMSWCHNFTRGKALRRAIPLDKMFARIRANGRKFQYVNFTDDLCRAGKYCTSYLDEGFIYKDDDHINTIASRILARKFFSRLDWR